MNDPDLFNIWIDNQHPNKVNNEGELVSSSSSLITSGTSDDSFSWYLMMTYRFQQASLVTQMIDMVLSIIVFIFAVIVVWALRKNKRLSLTAAILGAVHALGRIVYFAAVPVDMTTSVDAVLTVSTLFEFLFLSFWTVILVLFIFNSGKTAIERSAVRPMRPSLDGLTAESVPNVREQRTRDSSTGALSSEEHTSGYVPVRSPKPSDQYLMSPIPPSLDLYAYSTEESRLLSGHSSDSVKSNGSIRQEVPDQNSFSLRSILKECLEALKIDGGSRLRFAVCASCSGLTLLSFTASAVYLIVDQNDSSDDGNEGDKVLHVTSSTIALCFVRGAFWVILELCYMALSVWVLAKSREGLLFASSRKSPLRASYGAMILMSLKAVITPWDYLFAPIGITSTGIVIDYFAIAWYVVLIVDELIPLTVMLIILSRVTIKSIHKSRLNRLVISKQDSTGSMDSLSSMQSLSSLDFPLHGNAPINESAQKKHTTTPVAYSQGALLMNANLSLMDARPVADECFTVSLDSARPSL